MTHPLTDDLCCQIWQDNKDNWLMWQEPCPCLSLASLPTRRIMCGAADWQLDQVIEWLRDNLQEHRYSGMNIFVDYVIEDLREAMRPQENS